MSSTYLDGIGDDLIISTGAASATVSPDAVVQDVQLARPRTEIVFIEDNVADYQALAQQLGAGREVVILDSTGQSGGSGVVPYLPLSELRRAPAAAPAQTQSGGAR